MEVCLKDQSRQLRGETIVFTRTKHHAHLMNLHRTASFEAVTSQPASQLDRS
jgi:hypothetical protein